MYSKIKKYREVISISNYKILEKDAFRFIGFKTKLEGSANIHAVEFSSQKTEFFKGIIHDGKMALLQPLSESKYGYGVVTTDKKTAYYYAGVRTTQKGIAGTEEVLFSGGKYLVLSDEGGLSRLAFDKLENQAFNQILTNDFEYTYNGKPIAEVLLNGNPADAEVEVWIPIE